MDEQKASNEKNLSKNTRNIVMLGLVSLFVDMSTEMVYPIIPLFLVSLGTAPYIIGLIEGIAESIAAILRSFAGYLTDKNKNKKPLAIAGYSASIFYKAGLLLSASWIGVLLSRIVDKTGKGLRTAPRDSLIAESGGRKLGGSFGLHKMFDMLGAALGVFLAYIILSYDFEYKMVIIISVIPAIIGVAMLSFVREAKKEVILKEKSEEKIKIRLDKKLIMYLGVIFMFSLGTSSKAFLLLKSQSGGFDSKSILLLYLLLNVTASLFSIPFGKLSDKIGRKAMVVPSYILYAAVYFGFAFFTGKVPMILLFFFYGVYTAMISGAERALLVEMSPKNLKGTVLGLYGTMQGFGLLLSSTAAGLLWTFAGESSPFILGGILAVISAVLILIFGIGREKKEQPV